MVLRSLNVPDSEHDTEWAAVANRRLHDLREGRVESVSLEDVKNSVARRFSSCEEYVEFRHWFLERDFEDWERQIRIDSDGGKLDFLVREAEEDRASQNVNDC